MGPLQGIRVLDLSRVLAGPWAGQLFADMGADVLKVERPGGGDDTRRFGPPWITDAHTGEAFDAAYYASCNRGKRAITVDFTSTEGAAIVQRLAGISDVVLENYKVGGLARHGLDDVTLRGLNPRLIYCSITGFGQTGPYRERPGYDFLIQGMGGLMSVTGEPDGRPGGGPQRAGVALADIVTGLYAANAVLAALLHRARTGQGQSIDLALLDAQVAVLANQGMNWLIGGAVPQRTGNGHPNIVPYQVFATRDGHIILAVGNDEQFGRFCHAAGRAELAADPRFRTNADRNVQRAALLAELEPLLAARDSQAWIALLEAAKVPCGPINTIREVFEDPQVVARRLRLDLPHPRAGSLPSIANPIRYSATPIEYTHAPPTLGQHTDEVLRELLGLDAAAIARLRAQGVV